MPDIHIEKWIDTFHQYKFDKLSFEPLFKRALLILKDAWLRCLKDDVDSFTAAYYLGSSFTASGGRPPDETDHERQANLSQTDKLLRAKQRIRSGDTQINMSSTMIYIKRPWLMRFISSATSDRRQRFIEALDNAMSDEERQRLRAERRERLRRMEENRKKALKAARDRRKKQAHGKDGSDATAEERAAQARRSNQGFYLDRLLSSRAEMAVSRDASRLLLGYFQRSLKSSETAAAKSEHKLALVFEISKVRHSSFARIIERSYQASFLMCSGRRQRLHKRNSSTSTG